VKIDYEIINWYFVENRNNFLKRIGFRVLYIYHIFIFISYLFYVSLQLNN